MGYLIHTHLKEGRPCLRIVDAESGQECLHWCCERPPGAEEETANIIPSASHTRTSNAAEKVS